MCIWVRLWRPEVLLTLVALRLWSVRMVDVERERRPLASSVQQEPDIGCMNSWTSSVPLKLEEQKTTQFCLESICIVFPCDFAARWFIFVCFSNISNTKLRDNPTAAYRSIRRSTEHFASSGRALGVVVFEFARYFLIFFYRLEISRIRASCAASCRQ